MTTATAQGAPAAISMPTTTLADKLRVAAAKGQLDVVQELVAAGAGFQSDREGRAAIHFAAMNGHIEVCKYLLDHGCRVEEKDLVGSTALHRAASQGHVQVIELLLEKGCDMDSFDENGNAAVHEAAWHGFSQTLDLMIKHDCNTMVINKAGFSALHLAAQNGHNQSTRVLLLAGCNADMKNNYGDTALHTAARYGHAGVTRILISARCCLNEQNKNGDTALHIAAALKRRKIAKLLVDAGIDTLVKNKQIETALEVAKRKEHPEIVLIITSFAKPKASKSGVHKSVNFKDFPIELEGPVVVPDEQVPVKTEKQEKKFFDFFKKKKKDKDKDKSDNKGSQPQNDAPAGSRGNPSVQGFFSQYVPKPGYQYFRDLAGNIKQGPIGYTPVCQCMPTIKKLEHQVFTNRENLYDHIQASNRALNERMDHIDKKTSQQVGELDRYTKERLEKEEDHCNERIRRHLEEEQDYIKRYKDDIKLDIQDLLEAKLGMYGHCLDHHHDDSALPNNNIFTDVHENENGRLFRSRSDETLSQSDNHSGKFRKKEFYESRQQAMQQIRAWQMPMYNRESRDRGDNQRSVGQNNKDKYGVNPQVPNRNEPIRRSNQYVASKFDLQSPSTASTSRTPQVLSPADSVYAVNQGQGAIPKRLPHSQTWHNAQQFRNMSGTVNRDNSINAHSTPKHRESSPNELYAHGKGMVRSHTETDGLSQKKDQKDLNGNAYFDRKMDVRQSFPEKGSQYFNRGNEQRQSFPERGPSNTNTGNRPTSCLSSNAGQGPQEQNRPSSTKPEYQYSANQPTFTTFGYDGSSPQGRPVTSNQSASNNQTPVSSASHQRTRQENPYGYLPSRSRTPHDELSQNKSPSYSLFAVKYERSKTPLERGELSNSRISNKNTVPNKDDMYISMSQKPIARQRTHSSDGLLLDDQLITSAHDMARRSISEERVLDSPVQRSQTPRSSSETRPTSVQNKNSVAQPIYTSSSGNVSSSQTMAPSGAYQSPQTFRSSNYRAQNPRNVKPGSAPSNQGGISNQGTYSGRALRTPTENVYVTMKDSRVNREVVSNSHPTNPQNFQYGAKENGYRGMRESPYATVRDVSHHRANTTIHYPYTSGKQGAPYHSTYNVNRVTDSDRNMYAGGTVAQPLSKSESNLDRSANDSDHDCGYTSSVSPRGEFISRQTPVDNSSQSKDHLKPVANYPNAYNKEDSSSNPDSGYSSKIFGNRNNGGNIPSNSGTPSSSFSTDHDHSMSISSNNNSPHPQVSHSDYEAIQNVQPTPVQVQQGEHLQSHVQNWYQRKLKEAAHRFCDSPYSHEQHSSYQKRNYSTNAGQYQYQPTQSPDKYHNQSQYSMHLARNNATYNAYQQIPSYVRGSDV